MRIFILLVFALIQAVGVQQSHAYTDYVATTAHINSSEFGPTVELLSQGILHRWVVDTGTAPTMSVELPSASLQTRQPCRKRTLALAFSREKPTLVKCEVIDDFAGFRDAGMAGLLSPQQLFLGGTTIIDFPGGKLVGLRQVGNDAHLRQVLRDKFPSLEFSRVQRVGAPWGMVLVSVKINGGVTRLIDIDSGSPITRLHNDLAPDSHSASIASRVSGVDGVPVTFDRHAKVTFTIGEVTLKHDAVALVDNTKSAVGLEWFGAIGMDMLKGCVLVIPPPSSGIIYLSCQTDVKSEAHH
jgi:hypothetical protein